MSKGKDYGTLFRWLEQLERRIGAVAARLTKLEGGHKHIGNTEYCSTYRHKGKGEPYPVFVQCPKCGKVPGFDLPGTVAMAGTPCRDCIAARPPAPEGKRFTGEWRPAKGYPDFVSDEPWLTADGKVGHGLSGCAVWILEDVLKPEYPRWFRSVMMTLYRFDDPIHSVIVHRDGPAGQPQYPKWEHVDQCAEQWGMVELDAEQANAIYADAKKPEIHDAECCETCRHQRRTVAPVACDKHPGAIASDWKHCSLYERKESP